MQSTNNIFFTEKGKNLCIILGARPGRSNLYQLLPRLVGTARSERIVLVNVDLSLASGKAHAFIRENFSRHFNLLL